MKKKKKKIGKNSVGKDIEKLEPSALMVGKLNGTTIVGNSMSFPQKLKKNTIMYNPAASFVGITEVRSLRACYTLTIIVALFTLAEM